MKTRFLMSFVVTGILVLVSPGGKTRAAGDDIGYNNQGITYYQKGDYDRAIRDFTKAIEINPRYAKAYNYRGSAYGEKGDYDQAIRDFTKAIEINPKNSNAYAGRSWVWGKKGDYDKANADWAKAQELSGREEK